MSAELKVIQKYEEESWILEFHRCRTEIGEVDLIFSKAQDVIFLEVKTLNCSWRAFERIQGAQKKRLLMNLNLFSQRLYEFRFHAYVVWVEADGKISSCELSL